MSSSYSLRVRALVRAADMCGGRTELATNLGITERKLSYMLDGWAAVPDDVFLQVVDILSSANVPQTIQRESASPDA